MTQFRVTVPGLTRREFLDAARVNNSQLYTLLAVSMVVICGIIILFAKNTTIASVLWPIGIFVVVVGGLEILTRTNYKDQLAVLDPPVEYEFSATGWIMSKGESRAEIPWKGTPKLRKTKNCVFLFNDDVSSNLIPLRLLSEGQLHSIENWFKLSRTQAKEYQKVQDRAARAKFKEDHPGLRLGRTGPAWGPFRRRK